MERSASTFFVMMCLLIGMVIFIGVLTSMHSVTYLLKPFVCPTGELARQINFYGEQTGALECVEADGQTRDVSENVAFCVFIFTAIAFAVSLFAVRIRHNRLRREHYQRMMRRGFVLGDDGELIPRDEYEPHFE